MKVKIQHPGLPDGYKISLTGLNAILLNNEDVDVDEEVVTQYELVTGKKLSDVIQGAVFTGVRPERPALEQEEGDTPENEEELPNNNDGAEE